METSLIIATYNWPAALELVLLSLLKQSRLPDEIIIADDGSTKATKQLIERYTDKFQCDLHHIWQADKGFQKTKILNKAVAQVNGNYIIQIDGDIVLHTHFIKDHIQAAQKGTFIHGSRVFLNKEATSKAITNSITNFSIFTNGVRNRFNALYLPFLARIISSKNKNLKGTRGCNFSFWKKDFVVVNGYNEDMKGWGKEDTELSVRLMNNGLQKYKLKGKAVCYHLHHSISSREGLNINTAILETVLKNKIKNCTNGISKYEN